MVLCICNLNEVVKPIVQHSPPFKQSELYKLFTTGTKLQFKKGEIIQRANESREGVHFILEGFVREFTLSDDGNEHLTIVYEKGNLFSFNWIFLDIQPNVYRMAHTNVVVYRISADRFSEAIDTNLQFQREFMLTQINHVHQLSSRVENLTFNNAYDKVAYHLIHLAGRFGQRNPEGWFITLPFRHQQVAESLSMTRETASRMIERIEKEGYIKQDGKGHFIVKDVAGLASTIGVEEVLGMWPQLR